MSNLFNWETIHIDIDHAEDSVLVIHGDDESLSIEVPIVKTRGGRHVIIDRNIFGKENILPIDLFEHEIAARLTIEQQAALYGNWSVVLSIMTSRTANVIGTEKRIAKDIIMLGEKYGVLYSANNNTWKIKDGKVTRERWTDRARQLMNPTGSREVETITEVTKKYDAMTKAQQPQPERLVGGKVVLQSEYKKQMGKHPVQDSSVIEEKPGEKMLRDEMKRLENKIKNSIYEEDETPAMVVNRKNEIKRQLSVIENERAGEAYRREVNMQSNMQGVSIVPPLKVGSKASIQVVPLSKAKLIPSKKPLETKPLGKR